ncbi:helix-turn-helix domain-containing protein [Candidatus Woesearchaeota archaeon]|nr:helix-turn-helix domain-containing protein [Candidatus Woesearchaeota archaeon]
MTKINYSNLCSQDNLELAFRKARKGKTLKPYVIEFEKNLNENLLQLRNELLMLTYKPKPLTTFILRDPKTRKISKSDFRDRVIHHAICNIIEPTFEKSFIDDSYANRIGKGGLNAIKRFDYFKRKISKNNTNNCYVLKADIKHYFPSVNHNILLNLLEQKITDENILNLIKIILENHESKTLHHGMPLGNLTSQLFANIYLNELDQYVKHKLKAKHYIRYVDDFVILSKNKQELRNFEQKIKTFLTQKLKLELHPEKTKIIDLKHGINFLGFKIFYHYKTLQRKNKNKFKTKLRKTKKEYNSEKIEREKAIEIFEGHLAYASNANTYKYRKNLTKKFNKEFPINKEPKIQSVKKHENFNAKVEKSKFEFSTQKTLQLFKKGLTINQITTQRGVKEGTIWQHLATLVEHHQIKLKEILPNNKIKIILKNIKSSNDTLKEIKTRINNNSVSYNEINLVLANIKGKQKKKNIIYYIQWHQKTNCYRKCYYNKPQRETCRIKLQQLATKLNELEFNKEEFLEFINNHTKICELKEEDKKKFVSYQEFKKVKPRK